MSDHTSRGRYFFYSFRNREKDQLGALIRAFIDQLSRARPTTRMPLTRLYNDRYKVEPTQTSLLKTLEEMIDPAVEHLVVIDALDECPQREELLALLDHMLSNFPPSWRMFLSSRTERDIREFVEEHDHETVPLEGPKVRKDIECLIENRLKSDPKLCKWPAEIKQEITTSLMQGSQDM